MVVSHIVLRNFGLVFWFFCYSGLLCFFCFCFLVFLGVFCLLLFGIFLLFGFFCCLDFLLFLVFLVFWFSGFDTLVEDALVGTNSPCF